MPDVRLIDANAMMKRICGHECGMHPEDCDGMESETVPCNFHAYVSEAPTIDAHPVKHGTWERTNMFVKCSECGVELLDDAFFGIHVFDDGYMPFCPNCGAKMDGGDNDVG